MKRSALLLVLTLLFFSCTEIIFEEPQPPGGDALKNIPKELHGKYSFVLNDKQAMVEIGRDYITNDEDKSFISDSLVIKDMDNKYVVNMLISEGESKVGKWQVFILENKGCGFVKATSFSINSGTYMEKFKETYKVTQTESEEDNFIVVAPDDKQFHAICEDDSVTLTVILERIK